MVVAFGIGVLGAYMLDMHSHVCESCGTKWRHLGAFNLGDLDAHTCKKCGTVQWWKCGWQSAMDPRSVDGAFRTTAKPPAYPGAVAALRQELREVPPPALPSGWPPEPRR